MRISDWSSDVCSSDLSLLNNVTLPESFEYRVEGRIETPLAIVELHQYHFRQPQQALFDSPRGFLDLALTHRPGEARGSYVSAPGFSACPLGDRKSVV